jgi:hypothetical protein
MRFEFEGFRTTRIGMFSVVRTNQSLMAEATSPMLTSVFGHSPIEHGKPRRVTTPSFDDYVLPE